ncbi:alpha-(1-_6)-mannopyranosyltransferase A [Rhodococcus spongiicola]|uniref:Alpha-(1->6)-mannopyranosyltransferase A n=2 Tax=Rhodococcus spongiicola TaxID=2487352 RepID=A0A3S3DXJ5_9NOCA|nr:alpha-(1->6)-mannopyranosyltransferase A [Rhodococcus spongiicola]RVW00507.1 alpha-(1->6)-mannopyranosyltransferase A [Rhodococcus spongiicola]
MSARPGTLDSSVDRRSWLRASSDYLRTPEGHATILGFVGALMLTFGGFGAGSVRRYDPLLEDMRLSWLRFGHGYALSTLIIWGGVLAMIIAWVRLGRSAIKGNVGLNALSWTVPVWTAPMLFAVPMFSRDAYSYLAQGALLRDGFDPYAVGPVVNPGILLDNVSNVWTTTTAPYGPISLLLGAGITTITGDNVIAGTLLLRLTMLPGLMLLVWALPRLARQLGGRPTIAVWLAVLNPLVLIHLIGGVHNELLMVGLMVAGITVALDRRHVAAVAIVAVGVAVKAMAAIALPFIVWIWMIHERERALAEDREPATPLALFVRTAGAGVAVFGTIFAAASAVAGVGLGWLTALSGSAKIVNWLSLPTIMAHIVTVGTGWFTGLRLEPVLDVTRTICAVVLVGLLVWIWWRSRKTERDAVMGILLALVAIVILSPAALPWYYSWPLAIAAGFAMSTRTLQILVGLSTWLMLVFQPDGSIGLYTFFHVALAVVAAIVAAVSVRTVDPLRLRSVSEKTHAPTEQIAEQPTQATQATSERHSSPL